MTEVNLKQVLVAYDYAESHPHKYLRGTTNWCAAVAHSLNQQLAPLSPAHIEDGEEVELVGYANPADYGSYRFWVCAQQRASVTDPIMTVAQHQRIVAARSCPCQTDTARETRRKDGIEAAELQGILMRDYEACRPRDAGLMGWAAAALSAPPAAGVPEGWKLIPAQPSEAMLNQISPISGKEERLPYWWYQALIKSAPTPPASEQQRAVVMPEIAGTAIVEVVSGVEGPSLYIGDEDGGYRLAGPKPWGGGKTTHKFTVKLDELVREAMNLAAPSQGESE